MSKTITRLFDNYADAKSAVSELESLGFSHDDISIVANNAHGEHAGHDHDVVKDLGDVSRGGSLVSAKVDDARVPEAEAVSKRNRSVDTATRDAAYRIGGGTASTTLPQLTRGQIEQERVTYGGPPRV